MTPAEIYQMVTKQKERATQGDPPGNRSSIRTPLTVNDIVDLRAWIDGTPPERTYILEGLIPTGVTGVINSPGGVGKSNLLHLAAACAATTVNIPPFTALEPKRVFLLNVEDSEDDIWRRFKAMLDLYPELLAARDLLTRNLLIVPGQGKVFPFMQLDNGNPAISAYGEWIRQSMLNIRPDLAIFDTKSRLFGLDENSNDHAARWWSFFESIIREIPQCTVLVASHSGKTRSDDASQQSNRGASAFVDNARVNIVLNYMTEQEAHKYRVDRFDYFSMHFPKSNYSKRGQKYYFKKHNEGVPKLVELDRERFGAALDVLIMELKEIGGRICKRSLTDKAEGKEIREILKDEFSMSKAQFRQLVEYGIETTVLEQKEITTTSGRVSIDVLIRDKKSHQQEAF